MYYSVLSENVLSLKSKTNTTATSKDGYAPNVYKFNL